MQKESGIVCSRKEQYPRRKEKYRGKIASNRKAHILADKIKREGEQKKLRINKRMEPKTKKNNKKG